MSTLVVPYLDYANAAYCDLNDTLIIKLQIAHNACIRYVFYLRLSATLFLVRVVTGQRNIII